MSSNPMILPDDVREHLIDLILHLGDPALSAASEALTGQIVAMSDLDWHTLNGEILIAIDRVRLGTLKTAIDLTVAAVAHLPEPTPQPEGGSHD